MVPGPTRRTRCASSHRRGSRRQGRIAGPIDTLLLPEDETALGRYDETTDTCSTNACMASGEDHLEAAAIEPN